MEKFLEILMFGFLGDLYSDDPEGGTLIRLYPDTGLTPSTTLLYDGLIFLSW